MFPRPQPRPGFAYTAGGAAFLLLAMVGTMVAFTAFVLGVAMPIVLVVAIVLLAQRRALMRRHRWGQYRAMPPHHHRGMHPYPARPVRPVAPARPPW